MGLVEKSVVVNELLPEIFALLTVPDEEIKSMSFEQLTRDEYLVILSRAMTGYVEQWMPKKIRKDCNSSFADLELVLLQFALMFAISRAGRQSAYRNSEQFTRVVKIFTPFFPEIPKSWDLNETDLITLMVPKRTWHNYSRALWTGPYHDSDGHFTAGDHTSNWRPFEKTGDGNWRAIHIKNLLKAMLRQAKNAIALSSTTDEPKEEQFEDVESEPESKKSKSKKSKKKKKQKIILTPELSDLKNPFDKIGKYLSPSHGNVPDFTSDVSAAVCNILEALDNNTMIVGDETMSMALTCIIAVSDQFPELKIVWDHDDGPVGICTNGLRFSEYEPYDTVWLHESIKKYRPFIAKPLELTFKAYDAEQKAKKIELESESEPDNKASNSSVTKDSFGNIVSTKHVRSRNDDFNQE